VKSYRRGTVEEGKVVARIGRGKRKSQRGGELWGRRVSLSDKTAVGGFEEKGMNGPGGLGLNYY